MSVQTVGLMAFLVVLAVDFIGLAVDTVGLPTISNEVRRYNRWLGVLIVAWQLLGVLGLILHFWGSS